MASLVATRRRPALKVACSALVLLLLLCAFALLSLLVRVVVLRRVEIEKEHKEVEQERQTQIAATEFYVKPKLYLYSLCKLSLSQDARMRIFPLFYEYGSCIIALPFTRMLMLT